MDELDCMSLAEIPTNFLAIDLAATRKEMRRPASRRTSEMRSSGSRNYRSNNLAGAKR